MLTKYSAIAIALFGLGIQNAAAGNEQAQNMILGGGSVERTPLPAASTYKSEQDGGDRARALLSPVFVSNAYIGASTTIVADGHEQARRMIVGR